MIVGRVISGSAGDKIQIRVKNNTKADIGDILIIEDEGVKYYVKIVNVEINSLLPGQYIEDIAGQKLEHNQEISLFDEKDRFYKVVQAKILKIYSDDFHPARSVPNYFAEARQASANEFKFLNDYKGINIGCLRLGTRTLKDVNINLPANKLISHHVLVSAATGKGKSNFAKVFIRGLLDIEGASAIVIDPHNEYYGNKNVKGLRDVMSNRLQYFTPQVSNYSGSEQLRIYAEDLEPGDFKGVINSSQPQSEAMDLAYKIYHKQWLKQLLIEKNTTEIEQDMKSKVMRSTIASLKRKLQYALDVDLEKQEGLIFSLKERNESSIFDKIKRGVNEERIIIIDTSLVSSQVERLIAGSIVKRLFRLYKKTKQLSPEKFTTLPELMILFEEAPRVLGKAVLEHGNNTFSIIAREGRKFKVGLCAITQMPSLLPQEILSQMNTKVILGIPSPNDRQAIINSSAQEISDESTEIQMLDTGEALITSPFIKFPLPVKVHYFNKIIKKEKSKQINIGLS